MGDRVVSLHFDIFESSGATEEERKMVLFKSDLMSFLNKNGVNDLPERRSKGKTIDSYFILKAVLEFGGWNALQKDGKLTEL